MSRWWRWPANGQLQNINQRRTWNQFQHSYKDKAGQGWTQGAKHFMLDQKPSQGWTQVGCRIHNHRRLSQGWTQVSPCASKTAVNQDDAKKPRIYFSGPVTTWMAFLMQTSMQSQVVAAQGRKQSSTTFDTPSPGWTRVGACRNNLP